MMNELYMDSIMKGRPHTKCMMNALAHNHNLCDIICGSAPVGPAPPPQ